MPFLDLCSPERDCLSGKVDEKGRLGRIKSENMKGIIRKVRNDTRVMGK